jgi:hypothetical protein
MWHPPESTTVPDLACPNCRQTLRVPTDLMEVPVTCSLCQILFWPITGVVIEEEQSAVTGHETTSLSNNPDGLVRAVCPGCGKEGNAPSRLTGRRVRCRTCGQSFTVTAEAGDRRAGSPVSQLFSA